MPTLAPLDAVWLHMEAPTNLMMVTAVLWLDGEVSVQALRDLVQERVVGPYPHFRQRVEEPPHGVGAPRWVDVPLVELAAHVVAEALPPPGDEAALQALVSALLATPLGRDRPLWQLHLVQPAPLPGGGVGAALVCRLHHCMADGMALAQVLLGVTDELPGARGWTPSPHAVRDPHPFARVLDRVWTVGGALADGGARLVRAGQDLRARPQRLREALHLAADGTRELGHLVGMLPDHRTRLKGPLVREKRATWSPPLDLAWIKAIGRASGATLNDVLLAALAGGLRGWLLAHGEVPEQVRAFVPVDMRDHGQPLSPELGNRLSLVLLAMPVGLASRRGRLRAVKREMDQLKAGTEAVVSAAILAAMGRGPEALEHAVVEVFGTKASAIVTNVPGPPQAIHLAGRTVTSIQFWVPQSGRVGLGVSLFSYAGHVTVGIAADTARVPDPERLLAGILDELDALAGEVGLAPRPRPTGPAPGPS